MVFVLDKKQRPLMPCTEKRARLLLAKGCAVVVRLYPFTIRLKDRTQENSQLQPVRVKLDPGSKHGGIALIREDRHRATVPHLAQLDHRTDIRDRVSKRANYRHRRRSENLRYRAPRFLNRRRSEGWLAPSLKSRVDNVASWLRRYRVLAPITSLSVELARFDTQALQNPEIGGAEYQQGELAGYEIKEYLLEKFNRQCSYCEGLSGDPILNIDHIVPRAMGGSDRVSNLALACRTCNEEKGKRTPDMWAATLVRSRRSLDRARARNCATVQARAKAPLRDAAGIDTTRWAIYAALKNTGLPVEVGTGGCTKWNRLRLGLPKAHVLDAVCVGASTPEKVSGTDIPLLVIRASGRGLRRRTNVDASGFPRGYLPR